MPTALDETEEQSLRNILDGFTIAFGDLNTSLLYVTNDKWMKLTQKTLQQLIDMKLDNLLVEHMRYMVLYRERFDWDKFGERMMRLYKLPSPTEHCLLDEKEEKKEDIDKHPEDDLAINIVRGMLQQIKSGETLKGLDDKEYKKFMKLLKGDDVACKCCVIL